MSAAAMRQSADSLAEMLIARTDSAFAGTSVLSVDEVQRLRRYLQDDHLAQARRRGTDPIPDRRAAGELLSQLPEERAVVSLSTSAYYIVDPRMGYAVPLVVPAAAHILERIGQEYHRRLRSEGLPPYRFILTNILRTGVDQAHLQGTNANAARGESTHEFGTTFDIYYGRFHYAASADSVAQAADAGSEIDRARYRALLRHAYRERGLSYAGQLKGILGRTLIEMQDEGSLMVTYERGEPVFHVTISTDAEGANADLGSESERFYGNAESQMIDIDNDIEEIGDDAADASGTVRQRLERNLASLRELQEDAWVAVEGLEDADPSREARRDVGAKIAQLEGQIVRTRVESLERAESLRIYLRRLLRDADRTVTYMESWAEHADDDVSAAFADDLSDLRQLHGELERLATGTRAHASYERTRSDAAALAAEMTRRQELLSGRFSVMAF